MNNLSQYSNNGNYYDSSGLWHSEPAAFVFRTEVFIALKTSNVKDLSVFTTPSKNILDVIRVSPRTLSLLKKVSLFTYSGEFVTDHDSILPHAFYYNLLILLRFSNK
jgi:hypothetical protein